MGHFKYLADDAWEKLPLPDYRGRFFIESIVEKLSMYTPHFYQSRLMNVFSSSLEILSAIKDYSASEKNIGYIINGIEELDNCFSSDKIANVMFVSQKEMRENVFKRIRGSDTSGNQLDRIRIICTSIILREQEYEEKLITAIKEQIFADPTNKTPNERTCRALNEYAGLYTTKLLNKGFSPTYLFNRVKMLKRLQNYSGRSFKEQFEYVFEKLHTRSSDFKVYFAIYSNASCAERLESMNINGMKFAKNAPSTIEIEHINKILKGQTPNLFVEQNIPSTDYVSACWKAKENLDKIFDAITALDINPAINLSSSCIAINRNLELTHTNTLAIDTLISLISSENGTYLTSTGAYVYSTIEKLNDDSKDHLGRSLRYFRLARESSSLEQKLINLWIALESLFTQIEPPIIASISSIVPQLYAASSLMRRIAYLRNLLIANEIEIPPLALNELGLTSGRFDASFTNDQLFSILMHEKTVEELFLSITRKEYLKFRLKSIFLEFKTGSEIVLRIIKSENDVKRQLRRIYLLRNKIAHTGHYENIRPQLVTHLTDYIVVCYTAISEAAARNDVLESSISDLLISYKMGIETMISQLKSGPLVSIDNIKPIAFS